MGRLHTHKNMWGKPCKCTAGRNATPHFDPHWEEIVGSWKQVEAAKIDWLRDREDMQLPEHQKLLDDLQQHFPNHDSLYPWLVREHKKGRLQSPSGNTGHQWAYQHENGRNMLQSDHLDALKDYIDYKKKAAAQNPGHKGINIDQHEIGPLMEQAHKWDGGGEVVHTFGEDDGSYGRHYPGWTIKRLRNKRDMVKEGEQMSHCVGSNGMGYIEKNDEGSGLYYSLRDPDNDPRATLEMAKDVPADGSPEWFCEHGHHQNYMPPQRAMNEDGTQVKDEHGYGQYVEPIKDEKGVPTYPDHANHKCRECSSSHFKQFPFKGPKTDPHNPSAEHWTPAQLFGHDDKRLDHDHEQLVNEWLSKHGHGYKESDGDSDFEPWWEDYYEVPGAETAEQYIDHMNGDYYDYAPEEYENASSDANEHDMEGPELYRSDPDFHSIVQDMVSNPDPIQIAKVWKAAQSEGHADELGGHMREWMDDDYHPFVDPYGQHNGPGFMTIPGPPGHVTGPGHHYPESVPEEKYAALNFQHHLDSMKDPQTGEDAPDVWSYRNLQQSRGNPWSEDMTGVGNTPAEWQQPDLFQDANKQRSQQKTDLLNQLQRERNEHVLENPQGDQEKMQENMQKFKEWETQNPELPANKNQYVDWATKRLVDSHLPPHLFPPNKYQYVAPVERQEQTTPMWDTNINDMNRDRTKTYLNTQPPGQKEQDSSQWLAHSAPQILHTNSETYPKLEDHDWRIPVIHDLHENKTIIGQPGMEHHGMMQNFPEYAHLQNPWEYPERFHPGFIDTTKHVTDGGLHWFDRENAPKEIENEPALHDYVEQKYGVRTSGETPGWMQAEDEGVWS